MRLVLFGEQLSRLTAGVQARLTGVGTDAAVLVMLRMLATLVAACAARECASFELARDDFLVGARSPCADRSRHYADVRAIEVQTDALRKICDVAFAEAGVRAGRAGLRAAVALLDASQERVVGIAFDVRMRANHLVYVHGRSPVGHEKAH
jgi:hypothetical protein